MDDAEIGFIAYGLSSRIVKKVVDMKYSETGSFFEYTHLFTDLYVKNTELVTPIPT